MPNTNESTNPTTSANQPYTLRQHRPGDMGWVTHRHGVLYWQEYQWDERFEALVAGIVSDFILNYNPDKERCWIAERDGKIIGSVFLVQATETIAKLRLLLIEPEARGLGLGNRLVSECINFAKDKGYEKITLWTNDNLTAARALYRKHGFQLIATDQPVNDFGQETAGETWELEL